VVKPRRPTSISTCCQAATGHIREGCSRRWPTRAAGVADSVWMRFTAALGSPTSVADLDQLRDSTVADYLLQTCPDEGSEPVTRLFH
jgi:hypothetical protein